MRTWNVKLDGECVAGDKLKVRWKKHNGMSDIPPGGVLLMDITPLHLADCFLHNFTHGSESLHRHVTCYRPVC